jgi:hypothetical protein
MHATSATRHVTRPRSAAVFAAPVLACLLQIALSGVVRAQQTSATDLAKAAQNPVADMISVPFQNNTYFGIGPNRDTADVLNIQPVIPLSFGDVNVINRVIAPPVYLPSLTNGLDDLPQGIASGAQFGLGDINYTAFFSPARPSAFIWGIGPSVTLPTSTSDRLGSQKWSAGPSAVALITPGQWVIGALVRQLWSFAGSSARQNVNQTLIQPFINYNLPNGWFLSSSPIMTANWQSASGNRWLVPIGGGIGRLIKLGALPMQISVQAFDNVERPAGAPRWSLRFGVSFLFPK